MTIDEELLRQVRESARRWVDARHSADLAKVDYHHAVRRLHLAGASMREIADATEISHQRVHQIIESSNGRPRTAPKHGGAVNLACSLCGRAQAEVGKLIAGPGVYICDSCVASARQVVERSRPVPIEGAVLDTVTRSSKLRCSFCGKRSRKVAKLVAGPGAHICSECLILCTEIIVEDSAEPDSR